MKRIKVLVGIVAGASLLLGTSACGSAEDETDEPLTIGVINNNPPFEFEKDGDLTGFDIEMVEKALDEEGLEYEWRVMGFDGLIPALQSKKIDLAVSHVSITEEREKVVDFSEPYYTDGQSVAVAADSDISSLEDLKGKTIAATQGAIGLEIANEVADEYGAKVQTLTSSDALFLAVTSRQADALVIETSSTQYRIKGEKENPTVKLLDAKLFEAPIGVAAPKGSDALLDRVNSGLQQVRDSGAADEIEKKYLD